MNDLPKEYNPLNLKAVLQSKFPYCGCFEEDEVIKSIIKLLKWCQEDIKSRISYDKLYEEVGVFYILAGLLTDIDFIEHGTSVRYPWLTEEGKKFLKALSEYSYEEINKATGKAYDGIEYIAIE